MKKTLLVAAACSLPLIAVAWPEPAVEAARGPTPEDSVMASVRALRANDVEGFLRSVVDAEGMRELEREWDASRVEAPDPEAAREFRETMERLTAPGAEERLMAELAPRLEETRAQLPFLAAMFSAMAQAGMEQDDTLTKDEKTQAARVIAAAAQLVQREGFLGDEAMRRSVGVVCATARRLELRTLEDVRGLALAPMLDKGDVLLKGMKELLAIHGLDLDRGLDTVRVRTLSVEGDEALVEIAFELLGVPLDVDVEMVRDGERWTRKDTGDDE